jgi:hypothetical protein
VRTHDSVVRTCRRNRLLVSEKPGVGRSRPALDFPTFLLLYLKAVLLLYFYPRFLIVDILEALFENFPGSQSACGYAIPLFYRALSWRGNFA